MPTEIDMANEKECGVTLYSETDIPVMPLIKLAMLKDFQCWVLAIHLEKKDSGAIDGRGWYSNGRKVRIRFWLNLLPPYDLPGKKGSHLSTAQLASCRREIALAFAGHNRCLIGDPIQKSYLGSKRGRLSAKQQVKNDSCTSPEKKRSRRRK